MTDHTNARDKTGSIDLAGSPESSTFAETFNDGLCYYSVNVPRSPAGLIEWLQAKLLGTKFYEVEFGYGIVRHSENRCDLIDKLEAAEEGSRDG